MKISRKVNYIIIFTIIKIKQGRIIKWKVMRLQIWGSLRIRVDCCHRIRGIVLRLIRKLLLMRTLRTWVSLVNSRSRVWLSWGFRIKIVTAYSSILKLQTLVKRSHQLDTPNTPLRSTTSTTKSSSLLANMWRAKAQATTSTNEQEAAWSNTFLKPRLSWQCDRSTIIIVVRWDSWVQGTNNLLLMLKFEMKII